MSKYIISQRVLNTAYVRGMMKLVITSSSVIQYRECKMSFPKIQMLWCPLLHGNWKMQPWRIHFIFLLKKKEKKTKISEISECIKDKSQLKVNTVYLFLFSKNSEMKKNFKQDR